MCERDLSVGGRRTGSFGRVVGEEDSSRASKVGDEAEIFVLALGLAEVEVDEEGGVEGGFGDVDVGEVFVVDAALCV